MPMAPADCLGWRHSRRGVDVSLMLRARWKATLHLWHNFNFLHGHRICRLYRWWGFDTQAIWCTCGKVFGRK